MATCTGRRLPSMGGIGKRSRVGPIHQGRAENHLANGGIVGLLPVAFAGFALPATENGVGNGSACPARRSNVGSKTRSPTAWVHIELFAFKSEGVRPFRMQPYPGIPKLHPRG